MQYGAQRGVPWGISESAYNAQDLDGNYQYRAFGVPGLGLKRGLADDLVIAPYASVLAAPLAPADAVANLKRLARAGPGRPVRLLRSDRLHGGAAAEEQRGGVVLPTYMAHHQGMSLLALDNAAERLRRCSGGFTPIRGFRRPISCSRNASRTWCR